MGEFEAWTSAFATRFQIAGIRRIIKRLLVFMIQETDSKQLKLPDRKEITLCEAVTAFIHGEASDARWLILDLDLAQLPRTKASK